MRDKKRYHKGTDIEILLASSGWQNYPEETIHAGPSNDVSMVC
jgi:hypothetical protein